MLEYLKFSYLTLISALNALYVNPEEFPQFQICGRKYNIDS